MSTLPSPAIPSALPHLLLLFLLALSACRTDTPPADALFALRPPDDTGINFVNAVEEDTSTFNLVDYYYVYNGAGVAVGDVNNDGLPDLYFSGNMVPGRLYLNRGNLRFEDVTEAAGLAHAGWETGVVLADINGDGHLDLYICRAGPHPPARRANLLYLNNGDAASHSGQVPTFTERAAAFGIADTSASTQAAFFDYDKDGDLDLFLLNHSNEESTPNRARPLAADGTGPGTDRLYRNDTGSESGTGGGRFTDVSTEAGIVYPGMSLGVAVGDLDGDGWEDVYVANDFVAPDYVYVNNGDGTFRERGADWLKHHSYAAMGTDLADVDNDGRLDVMVVDMLPPDNAQQKRMTFPITEEYAMRLSQMGYPPQYWRNTLQRNNGLNGDGALSFSDVAPFAGVEATGWSWAPLFADFDNDGLLDLWITNGYRRAIIDLDFIYAFVAEQQRRGVEQASGTVKEMAAQLYALPRVDRVYRNRGDLMFDDVSADWGVTQPSFSNGAAYADLDNDGDLDVVVSRINAPAALYENTAQDARFLKVHLHGPDANAHGLGATLRLYCGGRMQHRHQAVTRGYQSSVDYALHFGLGACAAADSLRVVWPDGATQRLTGVAANQTLHLHYDAARPHRHGAPSPPSGLLTRLDPAQGLRHRHEEEPFNAFAVQRLLPHRHSQTGPGIAVGDVNDDGREDVFIGGAFRHPGRLFIQRADGAFDDAPIGEAPYYAEDTAPLFFDADGNGDLDLYVAAGSSEFAHGSEHLQDRLYLGDGSGRFTPAPEALPDLTTSSSCVLAADYDRDGDLDLFVGGRMTPGRYPLPGRSHLLRNDGGTFTDVTDVVAPALRETGMVTGGLWTDFNNDGRVDLIVVGEFMPIRFFENTGDRLREVTDRTGLAYTEGWWNSIVGGDFDRDGDVDYVVGNLGLNTRYEASPAAPVTVYAGDFDGNGHLDPILTHFVQGEEYPVARRDAFLTQFPTMERRFPDYESYADATLDDILSPKQRTSALTLQATRFASSYIENRGDGRFRIRPLPGPAQWGPLYGLLVDDVTGDGYLDVLAVGNSYAPDVITGRHDALVGLLLRGDGTGHFETVPHAESGFFVDGDAKGLVRLHDAVGAPVYVATQNDDTTRAFARANDATPRRRSPAPLDAYAEIVFPDSTIQRRELYYGAGYLSQSSRRLHVPPGAVDVTFYR